MQTVAIALFVLAFALLWHLPELTQFFRNRARSQRRRAAYKGQVKRAKVLPIERHPRLGSQYTEEY